MYPDIQLEKTLKKIIPNNTKIILNVISKINNYVSE